MAVIETVASIMARETVVPNTDCNSGRMTLTTPASSPMTNRARAMLAVSRRSRVSVR